MKEQRELDGMEAAILAQEEKAAAIETTLNDPEFYITRSLEAPALTAELEAVKTEVHRLYERWEELNRIAATA
jgi:ATP-binding cassette subfamily F protein uup